MSSEIAHLREVFEQRFTGLETWMDHFQQYMQRLTNAVEEAAKSHTDVALLQADARTKDQKIEKLEALALSQGEKINGLERQVATTNVVKQGAVWVAATISAAIVGWLTHSL